MKHQPRLPDNLRVYAVGDIHGRNDLLLRLMELIRQDSESAKGEVRLVFLGDYIDRGLNVKDVLNTLVSLPDLGHKNSVFIQGNHELMLRDILQEKDQRSIIPWLSTGGYETCLSYGIPPSQNMLIKSRGNDFIMRLEQAIPVPHLQFLEAVRSHVSFGDYFFCHAGVRPKVPLDRQSEKDMAWIREKFLKYNKPFEKVIVHGHTISKEPDVTPYRIGIDTGAYATGKLTALGLEGTRQWFLQT